MDELELLGEETLLAPEEAEEAEPAVPWWRQEAVVPLWLAVLLVTWSLLALSDWLGAPPPTSLARAVRSRRSLSALRPVRRSYQSQSQSQQPPQLTQRQPPPPPQQQPQRRTAAARDAGPSTAAAAAAGRGPSPPSAMAAPLQPQPGPSPSQIAAAAAAPAAGKAAPQIVRASPPPPQPQTSDESLEWDEAPQPLPPASIKHVNVLLGGRLWHEASLELLRLVSEPESSLVKNEEQARTLLSYHMKLLQRRASPAVLAQIAVHVCDWLPDVGERCAVLQAFSSDVAGCDVAAAICRLRQAELLLQQNLQHEQGAAAADAALPLLEEVEEQLVETPEVVPQDVSATCYRLLAHCYSIKKDLHRYQDAALKYLCYVDPMSLPEDERKFIAAELVVCSLLSEDINATAEMRLRPVLWALEESASQGWLPALLEAVDDGDVEAVGAAAPLLQREPRLLRAQRLLQEKAAVRALQAVCRSQRHVTMEEAAEATRLSEDEAEQVVLRALARGAVDGYVDRNTLFVERVRPSPVGVMQLLPDIKKLDKWLNNVSDQENRFATQMDSLIGL